MLNGSVIHPNIILNSSYYSVDIDLEDGYNSIDFVALNVVNQAQILHS